MKETRKKVIRRFKNLSVLQKMVVSLTACVIVPSILLGMTVSMRVVHLSEQNQYEAQINQLIRAAKDIESIYTMTEQSAAALANENSVQAIIEGSASVMDYRYAAQKLKEASENIKGCSSIALLKDDEILFQRGERYLFEEEGASLREQAAASGKVSVWLSAEPVTFQRGIYKTEREQVSYHTSVIEGMSIIGNLSVYLDTEEILKDTMPYLNGGEKNQMVVYTAVTAADGTKLMEEPKKDRQIEYMEKVQKLGRDKEYGYFSVKDESGENIVLFAKCGSTGWYLFQNEKRVALYNMQIAFMAGVIALCILFGVIYGMIQNRTIIQPLRHLSQRMDAVKSGAMEKEVYEMAHDEIGNVESGFEDMVAKIQKLINEVYIQTIKTKDAEREMLMTKMNPHFLYNALDSVHWLAFRNKDYEVSEQLEALADVYRHILQFGVGKIRVDQEVEFLDNYLFLLECQMGDRVEFIRDIPETLYGYEIPKLMLQPLVENAVNHGLRNRKQGGRVKIKMRKRGENLVITVADNGVGCDTERLWKIILNENSKEAFALRNIAQRMKLNSGTDGYMKLYSRPKGGFLVELRVFVEEKTI